MNTFNKKMPFLLVTFLLFALINSYGQEILPKEKEREIKMSGKYFYSECSAFDVADAKECALRDLAQITIIEMIKQSIKLDEVEFKNAMEMRAQTAQLNLTGKIRILSWIEKDKILMDDTQTQTTEPTIIQEQTSTSETNSTTNTTQETESIPISSSVSAQTSTPIEPEPARKPEISAISNPIIRDLATCEVFVQFQRKADGLRRQGKIVYGTKKTSFLNPDNCFVAVFTTEQILIAMLDTGQNSRIDLITGKTIQNPERQFADNILYWIQTIN